MISNGTIRAVNPYRLAVLSGITKIPRFSAPIAPVPRPQLLTGQLNGVCCGNCGMGRSLDGGMIPPDYGTLRGMRGVLGHLGQTDSTYTGDPGTQTVMDSTTFSSDPTTYLGLGAGPAGGGTAGQVGSDVTSVLGTLAAGTSFVPGVGEVTAAAATVAQIAQALNHWIGSGRREADVIVPVQNQLVYQDLAAVTNQILTGQSPSLTTLVGLYKEVWVLAVAFQEFVLSRRFTDRRASGQALNTIMPYMDGSCGYAVPLGLQAYPSQQNCLSWGDGTLGGVGTNGMLGALSRAIQNAGGSVPAYTDIHTAANVGVPVPSIAGVSSSPTGVPGSSGVQTPYGTYGPGTGYTTGFGSLSGSTLLVLAAAAYFLLRK